MEDHRLSSHLSFWEKKHFIDRNDFTIIGGGIVGLSSALALKDENPDLNILIIDKKNVPLGASTKNAGFACFGSISEILDDVEAYGEAVCHKLLKMRWNGLHLLKQNVDPTKMDFEDKSGIELFASKEEFDFYENNISKVNKLIHAATGVDRCLRSGKNRFGHVISNHAEGCLNPQKMIDQLEIKARSVGIKFLYGVKVIKIEKAENVLHSSQGILPFSKLIICTNGFSKEILPDLNIEPARNQVMITKPIDGFHLDGCYHVHKGYVYFRSVGQRLLIGGGRHIALEKESTSGLGITESITDYLKNIISTMILPDQKIEIEHQWSGILGVGQSKMPIVRSIEENIVVAIRMGGMGVAIGSFIGKVAAALSLNISNTECDIFVSESIL